MLDVDVGATNPGGLHRDLNLTWSRRGNRQIDEMEMTGTLLLFAECVHG
jgi:hypothetical protein